MSKSVLTNFVALSWVLSGLALESSPYQPLVMSVGLFALSGSLTNWIAVHMLFEKVPLLYGSGVIPLRFEAFKAAIENMMMQEFFNSDNLSKFLNGSSSQNIDLEPMIRQADLDPAFDGLIEVVENSSFGGMLAMVGGTEILQPMREPFKEKMCESLAEVSKTEEFQNNLSAMLSGSGNTEALREKISAVIIQRLDELTPQMVKEMVQKMIAEHLGWLVVWGGLFGGLIGLINALWLS